MTDQISLSMLNRTLILFFGVAQIVLAALIIWFGSNALATNKTVTILQVQQAELLKNAANQESLSTRVTRLEDSQLAMAKQVDDIDSQLKLKRR